MNQKISNNRKKMSDNLFGEICKEEEFLKTI